MLPMNAEFTEWKTDAFMNQATTAGQIITLLVLENID